MGEGEGWMGEGEGEGKVGWGWGRGNCFKSQCSHCSLISCLFSSFRQTRKKLRFTRRARDMKSSIYHHHIEHFFTFLAGNTVFSLVSESPR